MQKAWNLNDMDFSFLDQDEFKARYAAGQSQNQIRFYVGGISCSKCVRKLEDLPLTIPGLRSLRIEMGKNLAHAEIDPSQVSFSEVAERIVQLGFHPTPLTSNTSDEQLQKSADRRELIRLGVAAACAGNIMTFSFALYLGAGGGLGRIFGWLSFALYLPVVFYVALPFYRGAWSSLKRKQLSIDLPMSVASLFGFIFSTVELLRGRDDIYFDSLSGFLFLILVSRWIHRRVQTKYLRPEEFVEGLRLERVRLVSKDVWSWSPVSELKAGQRILISAPETLPAESELVSSSAHFSLAWLSGESKPHTFLSGATVPAGARLLSGDVQLIVRRPLSETGFGQILHEVQNFTLAKNNLVNQADRWSQWLLLSVFSISLAFLAAYWPVSAEEAIRRSLALIILACPCAMAFGTPLALSAALRRARRLGLIIRNANVFEKVREIQTVYLDKTGTLTETDLVLLKTNIEIPQIYQKIVLALENESMHPIAFAFRKSFSDLSNLPPVEGLKEVPGIGVSGFIHGKFYELRRNSASKRDVGCALFEDYQLVAEFAFVAQIKTGTYQIVQNLRRRGLEVKLLSGDNSEAVADLGRNLGFRTEDIIGNADPAKKASIVKQMPKAMMVGDGVNDSLALLNSHVGVAVAGGMESALRSSDVYLLDSGLQGLSELFETSDRALRLIRSNLVVSVIYNTLGGALALMGFVNPLVAALLMPASSGFILLNTWLRSAR